MSSPPPALFPPPARRRPVRIRRERRAGWRLPPGAVCVDRTSRWGNPFAIGRLAACPPEGAPSPYAGPLPPGRHAGFTVREVKDRRDATILYTAHLRSLPDSWLQNARTVLGGRDLACWCPLPAEGDSDWCHAAILLQVANPGHDSSCS